MAFVTADTWIILSEHHMSPLPPDWSTYPTLMSAGADIPTAMAWRHAMGIDTGPRLRRGCRDEVTRRTARGHIGRRGAAGVFQLSEDTRIGDRRAVSPHD